MNNSGQIFFFTLMLGAVIVVITLAMVPAIKQQVDLSMANSTPESVGLDCANTNDSYVKGQCVLTDLATPYFFYGLLGIAGMVIGAKLLLGGVE